MRQETPDRAGAPPPPRAESHRLPVGPLVALGLFVLLAIAGGAPPVQEANVAVTRWAQAEIAPSVGDPVTAVLALGSTMVSAALVAAWGGYLFLRGRRLAAFALGLFFGGVAVEVILKATLHHPAVWPELHRQVAWYPGEAISSAELGLRSPFPSGHLLRTAFLTLTASNVVAERARPAIAAAVRVVAWVLIAAAGVAVVWAGWHWAVDAVAGAALGYALATVAAWLPEYVASRMGRDGWTDRTARRGDTDR